MSEMLGDTSAIGCSAGSGDYKDSVVSKSHSNSRQNVEEVVALVYHDQLSVSCAETETTEHVLKTKELNI